MTRSLSSVLLTAMTCAVLVPAAEVPAADRVPVEQGIGILIDPNGLAQSPERPKSEGLDIEPNGQPVN